MIESLSHKTTFFLIFLFFLLACDSHSPQEKIKEWTEQRKRNYFADSIAYRSYNGTGEDSSDLNNWYIFVDSMYPNIQARYKSVYVYALEESYVDTTKIDSPKEMIRFFVYPSFQNTYCYIVERKYKKTYITIKTLDKAAGGGSGMLDFTITQTFPDSIYDLYSEKLNKANFWGLEEDTTCYMLDGEEIYLEALEDGKYHVLSTPYPCYTNNALLLESLRDSLHCISNFNILHYAVKKQIHYTQRYKRN